MRAAADVADAEDAAGLPYVELHCLSSFSFLRGASQPDELIRQALALEYRGLALTDECSFAGSVRAHLALRELRRTDAAAADFQLIHGTELRLAADADGPGPQLLLLARNRIGYGDLSQLVTLGRQQAPKGSYRLTRADLDAHRDWLQHALALLVPQAPAGPWPENDGQNRPDRDLQHARWLQALLPGRAWIACELLRDGDDAARLARLAALAQASGLPLVAAGDVHMHMRSRQPLQDVLTAVRLKTPLARLGRRLLPNAERYLRPRYRLARIYPRALLTATLALAAQCRFSLDELRYEYPEEVVPAGETPASWLRQATYAQAALHRYPDGMPDAVRAEVERELALIAAKRYETYFLTVYDIVREARRRGILCQGRGSAANSAVCYCLGITEVDPARSQLLFERFISAERDEPPDIDVDFEHERREELMQYIYDKYGRERAALTAALHTYHPRGALRDVGKALGLSLDQINQLARTLAWWDGRRIAPERLIEAGFDPDNPVLAQVVDLAHQLVGFPRHLSQHTGGFVIARDRLDRLVPIENAAMVDRSVIQWDKDDLDALGLMKVDVLALGMLTCIRRALDHLERFYPDARARLRALTPPPAAAADDRAPDAAAAAPVLAPPPPPLPAAPAAEAASPRRLRMQDLPKDCPAVYAMLRRGDTIGVFQVESRAQINMLPRLAPETYYDLVIQVAIVRPGPIQGDMVHPYLRRRQGLEPVSYPSEEVKAVLERTRGVPIFQEQVMKLVQVAAGFSADEADQLRRAMATWKRRGGIGKFRDMFFDGMHANGYERAYAERIYRQMEGFGEYGFPESHAAGFALLVYYSGWLKCHEPAAFCAALLDAQPLGFYGPSQLIRDARAHGVEVRPIDVTRSDWFSRLEPAAADPRRPALRLGLKLVSGFNEAAAQRIEAARGARPFADAADLARRASLDRRELDALAAADALATLSGHRRRARWAALGLDPKAERGAPLIAATLVDDGADHGDAAHPPPALPAPTEGEEILADYAHTAFTLRRHPLALLRPRLTRMRLATAAEVLAARPRQRIRSAGLVTCRQRPGTPSGVIFVTLEDETGILNVVLWTDVGERYRRELLGARLLAVYGHVERIETEHTPVVHLIAQRLVDHSALLGRLSVASHDFH